jgi:predicted phosphodiesterase
VTYAVISDVHSNLEALSAVLEDLKKRNINVVYFLGDSVGYGPNPDECIDILKKECKTLLAGNHDWAVAGLTDISYFNVYARAAIEWTKTVMKADNIEVLRSLPVIETLGQEHATLVHSTPFEPEQWHYLLRMSDAELNFQYFDTKACFIAHSHNPGIMERFPSGEILTARKAVNMKADNRYIINVGSVGQPRDGDPRSSFVLVDGDRVEIERVSYSIETTQRKMSRAGLPNPLIERLSFGM